MKKTLLTLIPLMAVTALTSCSGNSFEYEIMKEELAVEEYAIGFRKGEVAFKNKVEEALVALKKDGTLAEISEKWFVTDNTLIEADYVPTDVPAEGDASWDYITTKGNLIIGFDQDFPPMTFKDDNGKYVGFDIECCEAVCDYYDLGITYQPIDWDMKENELAAKNIDVIWCGLTVNEDRKENLTLSVPYIGNAQVAVIEKGKYSSLSELEGKIIGAQSGSTALDAINECDYLKDNKVVQNSSNITLLELELKSGNVEAVIMDKVVAGYYLAQKQ